VIRTVKSLLLPALLMLAGCIPAPAQSPPIPDGTPVAFIDSVSATTVAEGQTVTFSGHGTDVGRTIGRLFLAV
jgi:starvation-inducible outer membrane lipoprotein